eukprot:GHVH01002309.1.p1 GENE.GHVH01002309.1~~GHVH01002309.1.p1  ORF type:complete len:203 (-),score=21.66 GHVH01002309.1:358-966(-)
MMSISSDPSSTMAMKSVGRVNYILQKKHRTLKSADVVFSKYRSTDRYLSEDALEKVINDLALTMNITSEDQIQALIDSCEKFDVVENEGYTCFMFRAVYKHLLIYLKASLSRNQHATQEFDRNVLYGAIKRIKRNEIYHLFEFVRVLGRGAFGEVSLVRDGSHLNRTSVVKILFRLVFFHNFIRSQGINDSEHHSAPANLRR